MYIIYIYYSSSILLCDDTSLLSQLKLDLTHETSVYRTHNVNYEYFTDLKNQMENLPSNLRDVPSETDISERANISHTNMNDSLNKIRRIERSIRNIEPTFKSPIVHIDYPRIGR